MKKMAMWSAAGMAAVLLSGCGGSNSPILGTGSSPKIRAQNLVASSGALNAVYNNSSNPIGTVAALQLSSYTQESEGNNTVSFLNGSTTIASLNQVYQYSNYYTVSIYSKNGVFGTFALADNNIALDNGTSQIRGVDAMDSESAAVDVYLEAGAQTNPTITTNNLISSTSGLTFGTATAYKSETPGQYTITVTPVGSPGTILLNQVVTLTGGQSISVYALDGSTSTTTVDDEGG